MCLALTTAALVGCGQKADTAAADAKDKVAALAKDAEALVKETEAREIGIDAYIVRLSAGDHGTDSRVSTNVADAGRQQGPDVPVRQAARLSCGRLTITVTAPNADTLYTVIWLDVSKEPWIVSAPDMKGRFFLLPILDGWTTVFADPGKRTTGTNAQKFAITGPGWTGTLPAGVKEYKSATNMVWMLGRIYCTGTPEDYKTVHALQDQMTAAPLSSFGKPYTAPAGSVDPAIDMKTSIRDQVNAMDAAAYFKLFATAEGQSASRGRCADGRQAREDRHRAGAGFRRVKARSGGRQGTGRGAEACAGQDHGLDEGRRGRRRLKLANGWTSPPRRASTARTIASGR